MSRNILLLALVFAGLVCTSYTLKPHSPWHSKRSIVVPSQCSFLQCAVSHGNCALSGPSLTFCPLGEHCDGNVCADDIALGGACNASAPENQCGAGSCIDTGSGPTCQIYQSILPGNPCTADSQCYYSQTADGSGSDASTCANGFCAGQAVGASCLASHQCIVGLFCSASTSTCTPLGSVGAACTSDDECSTRYTCLANKCSQKYTQARGQQCITTDNCAPGLFCNAGACATASNTGRTNTPCSITGNACGTDMECSCANYTTQGLTATCTAIQGTFADMPQIEQSAFNCLDTYNCGDDVSNATTIQCIQNNCLSPYCTYFTRTAPELFTEYPSCLVAHMVDSQPYTQLLAACSLYEPIRTNPTTSAGYLSATFGYISLLSFSFFLFAF